MNRARYATKLSRITLAVSQEPEDYLKDKLNLGWQPMKIYYDMLRIATVHKLPMISRRTLYSWIDRLNNGAA